jgi:hypothetical protein
MMDERRSGERVDILGSLPGSATVSQPIVITELGPLGAQIESPVALHIDSVHDFRIVLGDTAVVVRGRVAHCHVSDIDDMGVAYKAGIEFLDTPSGTLQAIAAFVAGMKSERRG